MRQKVDWKRTAKDGVNGTVAFAGGMAVGTLLDVFSRSIYGRCEGYDYYHIILLLVVVVQMFILVFVTSAFQQATDEDTVGFFYLRLGFITSQAFLLQHAVGHLTGRSDHGGRLSHT